MTQIRLSASQIKTFKRCPRAWYYYKVKGKAGSSKATRFGNLLHGTVEHYLNTGIINAHQVSQDVLRLFDGYETPNFAKAEMLTREAIDKGFIKYDPHQTSYLVEERIRDQIWSDDDRYTYLGYIDLLMFEDGRPVEIIDHKTTSSLKYAENEWTLGHNDQINLYALHVMRHYGLDKIKVSHIQYLTKDIVKVYKVSSEVTREGAEKVLEAWRQPANNIRKILQGVNEMDVERNTSACYDFGPCQHMKYCHEAHFNFDIFDKAEVDEPPKKEKAMSNNLLDRWKNPQSKAVQTEPKQAVSHMDVATTKDKAVVTKITVKRMLSDNAYGHHSVELEMDVSGVQTPWQDVSEAMFEKIAEHLKQVSKKGH